MSRGQALASVLCSHEATLAATPATEARHLPEGGFPSGPADSFAGRLRAAAGHSPRTPYPVCRSAACSPRCWPFSRRP